MYKYLTAIVLALGVVSASPHTFAADKCYQTPTAFSILVDGGMCSAKIGAVGNIYSVKCVGGDVRVRGGWIKTALDGRIYGTAKLYYGKKGVTARVKGYLQGNSVVGILTYRSTILTPFAGYAETRRECLNRPF